MLDKTAESKMTPQPKERLTVLASYFLASAMLTCLAVSLVQFGEAYAPGWDGTYLVALSFFLALEALYSHRLLRNLVFSDPQAVAYRAAELVVIMVGLKVAYYVARGPGLLVGDLSLWREDFWNNFFTDEYLFGLFTAALVWFISTRMGASLVLLEFDERVLMIEAQTGIYESRSEIRWNLANDILGVGVILIVLSAFLRFEPFTAWADLQPLRQGAYNALVYFFLALVLLSITQFNIMRSRWFRDSLPVHPLVTRRWLWYSLVFILGVAILAGVLPTGYSVGLLGVLNYLLFAILAILNLLVTILLTPLFLLIHLLASLFGTPEAQPAPQVEIPQFIPQPAAAASEPLVWWELLKSILFWLVLWGVVGYSIYYYLREHSGLAEKLRKTPLFPYLARFWAWLSAWWGGLNRQVAAAVDAGLARLRARRERAAQARPWRYLSLRGLSARERVIFYYIAMVRRGSERGLARQPSQTPYEYSRGLAQAVAPPPGAIPDDGAGLVMDGAQVEPAALDDAGLAGPITAITDKFVEARYSLHPVTGQDVGLVQHYWQRIRRALRRRLQSQER